MISVTNYNYTSWTEIKQLGGSSVTEGGDDLDCNFIATIGYPEPLKIKDVQKVIDQCPYVEKILAAGKKKSYMAQIGYLERQGFNDCFTGETKSWETIQILDLLIDITIGVVCRKIDNCGQQWRCLLQLHWSAVLHKRDETCQNIAFDRHEKTSPNLYVFKYECACCDGTFALDYYLSWDCYYCFVTSIKSSQQDKTWVDTPWNWKQLHRTAHISAKHLNES